MMMMIINVIIIVLLLLLIIIIIIIILLLLLIIIITIILLIVIITIWSNVGPTFRRPFLDPSSIHSLVLSLVNYKTFTHLYPESTGKYGGTRLKPRKNTCFFLDGF